MLIDTMRKNSIDALKNGDSQTKSWLSVVISESVNASLAKNSSKEPSDEIVLSIIKKQLDCNVEVIEQLRDKIEYQDRISLLKKESEYLSTYLPKQLSEQELDEWISAFINEIPLEERKKSIGKVMNALKLNFAGKYDGNIASKLIKDRLC